MPDDFDCKTDAVFERASPSVRALVGGRCNELVDQVAFRSHDLDPVVAGFFSQFGAGDEILDLVFDFVLRESVGFEEVDRGLDSGRGDQFRVEGIAAGVQDLHGNFAARLMDRLGDDPVIVHFFFGGEFGGVLRHTTGFIGGDAAGDDQARSSGRPFGIKCRQSLKTVGRFLEAGMHRSHDDPIFKGDKPKVKRRQHVRVGHRIHVRRSKWFSQ